MGMSDWLSVLEGVGLTLLVKGDLYKFISTVFGKSAEAVSETISNEIRCFNAERVTQAIVKSYQRLKDVGIEPKTVKYKTLIPLLEGISIEDDETLQQKWVNLLSAAVAIGEIHPSYISILKDLDSLDAKILNEIGKFNSTSNLPAGEHRPNSPVSEFNLFLRFSEELNYSPEIVDKFKKARQATLSSEEFEQLKIAKSRVAASIDNLLRQRLIRLMAGRKDEISMVGDSVLGEWGCKDLKLSPFGERFLRAISNSNYF